MNVTLSVETAGQRADQFLAARLDGLCLLYTSDAADD